MKHLYLAADAYDFNSPKNTFLAVYKDGEFKNINDQLFKNEVIVENVDNFVGGGESFDYNLYIIDNKTKLIPFIYSMDIPDGENTQVLTLTFGIDTPKEYIKEVMWKITKEHFKHTQNVDLKHVVSKEKLFYENINEINIDFLSSRNALFLKEDYELSWAQTDEDFVYLENLVADFKNVANFPEDKMTRIEDNLKEMLHYHKNPTNSTTTPVTPSQLFEDLDADSIPF